MARVIALLFSGQNSLDSFSDRLNCRITVCILLVISVLAMVRVLVRAPITCFTPIQFSADQTAFAEQACWLSETYYNMIETDIPEPFDTQKPFHAYYRWIPLLLTLHAFFFYLPKLFWKFALSISGSINVLHITSSQTQRQQNSFESYAAEKNVHYMAICLGRQLAEFDMQRRHASRCKRFWLLMRANCTFLFYIVVKLLYAVNCLLQLILISGYLGGGVSVLHRLNSGRLDNPSPTETLLPRRIQCEIEIRHQSRVHIHVLDCTLPLNFWYEIVLLFLLPWFLFVLSATLFSLGCFVVSMVNFCYQERYCRLRLMDLSRANETQSKQVSKFIRRFLTRDAWFIVQKVGVMAGDQTATELLRELWNNYTPYKQESECTNWSQSSELTHTPSRLACTSD